MEQQTQTRPAGGTNGPPLDAWTCTLQRRAAGKADRAPMPVPHADTASDAWSAAIARLSDEGRR